MTNNVAVLARPETDSALHAVGPKSGQDVHAWLQEIKRLVAEVEERLDDDAVLPALSSLAAIPPLHHMLMGRCSELLHEQSSQELDGAPDTCGTYL
jgi:hypothetical protein